MGRWKFLKLTFVDHLSKARLKAVKLQVSLIGPMIGQTALTGKLRVD